MALIFIGYIPFYTKFSVFYHHFFEAEWVDGQFVIKYVLKYESLLETDQKRMKIFFTGSPRALRIKDYKNDLNKIFQSLEKYGKNLSRLVVDANPDEFYKLDYDGVTKHYQITIDHLKNADIVVAEVSMQSMSMGYLVNMALNLSKPTLCLYRNDTPPFFLSGISDLNLIISEYDVDNIDEVVGDAFDYFSGTKDRRFNLMIPPVMHSFLTEEASRRQTTKAGIIRSCIKKMMESYHKDVS